MKRWLYFLPVTWPGGLCDEGPSELLRRGDIALAAGFIAYAGPFTAAFRGAPGAPAAEASAAWQTAADRVAEAHRPLARKGEGGLSENLRSERQTAMLML